MTRDGTILIYRTTVFVDGQEVVSILLLVTIVDDSILGYQHKEVADKYFDYLRSKAKIVVTFEPKKFVGFRIHYDRERGIMQLDQTDYIFKLAQMYGINKEDPTIDRACTEEDRIALAEGTPDEETVTLVRSMTGGMAWVAYGTRADVIAALKVATRTMHKPTPELVAFLKRLLQFLFNTRADKLTFKRGEWVTPDGTRANVNQIIAYVDSSWANAGPEFNMKSQYGFAIQLNGGCVAAGSGLSPCVADSSSYAEVMALHVASKDIVYLQQIIDVVYETLGQVAPKAIIMEDNTTAVAVMTNNKSATRSRHFNIKFFYLADLIQSGVMSIKYIPTAHQVADILTKATPAAIFQRLRKWLLGNVD